MIKPFPPLSVAAAFLALLTVAQGAVNVNSSTVDWTIISYANQAPDFSSDEQATSVESDIVGNAQNAAFYKSFYDGGTTNNHTDGELGFRLRLGGDKNPSGFSGCAFIGLDLNGNGALDVFLGVDKSGSNSRIGIWKAGGGSNTSPNTTTLENNPTYSTAITVGNYSWAPVNSTIDPVVTDTDIDQAGASSSNNNDFFLTFKVDFAELVTVASSLGITMDDTTAFSMVAATSTQNNSLNQDLNGVDGATGSSLTWSQLGGISQTFNAASLAAVPEPGAVWMTLLSIPVLMGWSKMRKKARA